MQSTVYHRLFARLSDLVPNLANPTEGAAFYAPPRLKGDIASHCAVSKVAGNVFEVEIAHDETIGEKIEPAPWMVFRVNAEEQTAELLVMQDQWAYEVVVSDSNKPNLRRSQMNVFAVNYLTTMINLGGAFCPVDAFAVERN
jgi:uncharacterized protein YqiB (DUF1249 family)